MTQLSALARQYLAERDAARAERDAAKIGVENLARRLQDVSADAERLAAAIDAFLLAIPNPRVCPSGYPRGIAWGAVLEAKAAHDALTGDKET